jgi:hypothetical protein
MLAQNQTIVTRTLEHDVLLRLAKMSQTAQEIAIAAFSRQIAWGRPRL